MGKIETIEYEIERFSAEEFASFCRWFAEFDALKWDAQIERDAVAGKLDQFSHEALADLRNIAGQASA